MNSICSTEFLPWTPKPGASREFLYCVMKSESFQRSVQQLVTGTSNSHQRVNAQQLALLSLVVAPGAILRAFATTVSVLLSRVIHAREYVQSLEQLRDELLPRLISGQLRVPEAQEALAEALA